MKWIIACAWLLVGCAHVSPSSSPPNLRCWEGPDDACTGWRGGQPTKAQLIALGARTDLKLNLAIEGRDDVPAGVEEIHHPWSPVGPVTHEEVTSALWDLVHALRPVYVHCSHGVDRTGLLIALYRVLVEHRPASVAWDEWRSFPRAKTDALIYDAFERETGFHIPDDER